MKPSKPLTTASSPVISSTEVTPGVHLVWLESPQIASAAGPGQFVMVRCGEDTMLRRPLSIHQVDKGKTSLALLFKVVGKGTLWLSQCQSGDKIDLFGPLGNGYSIHPASHNLLLVAGGMGIAPLSLLADVARRQERKVTLLVGASSAVHLLPDDVLLLNINIIKTTEDGSDGFKGLITSLIGDYIDDADQIFACGPLPMYRTMTQMPELKNKPVQISLEMKMGCGLGICYGCTIRTKSGLKQVCKNGPVFDLDDIIWDKLTGLGNMGNE